MKQKKCLKNNTKCDISVNRRRDVLKTSLWHIKHVLSKRKEKDRAMFIIASPLDNSKWRLS